MSLLLGRVCQVINPTAITGNANLPVGFDSSIPGQGLDAQQCLRCVTAMKYTMTFEDLGLVPLAGHNLGRLNRTHF